jgi:2-oxoglutarate ferredoxin oxidoreductase subunit beta
MTQCPTNFGRRNKFRQVADQVEFIKSHSLLKVKSDRLVLEGKKIPGDMFVVGELARRNRPAMGVQ